MNKTEKIIDYMKSNKKTEITQLDAYKICFATRLSDIIYRMKKKGYNVVTEYENITDMYGDKTRCARYFLKDEKGD